MFVQWETTLNQLVKTIGSSLKIKSVQTKNKSPDQSVVFRVTTENDHFPNYAYLPDQSIELEHFVTIQPDDGLV